MGGELRIVRAIVPMKESELVDAVEGKRTSHCR